MAVQFHPPAANDRGPHYAEPPFTTLVHDRGPHPGMTVAMTAHQGRVEFWLSAEGSHERRFAEQLLNAYPGSSVTPLSRDMTEVPNGCMVWSTAVRLVPSFFPMVNLTRFVEPGTRQFNDPLTTLVTALQTDRSDRVRASVLLHVRPARKPIVKRSKRLAHFWRGSLTGRDPRRTLIQWAEHDRFIDRLAAHCMLPFIAPFAELAPEVVEKLDEHLLEASLQLTVIAPFNADQNARRRLQQLTQSLTQFTTGQGRFKPGPLRRSRRIADRGPRPGSSFLLTPAETALLWHPPLATVAAPRLDRTDVHELEPPEFFPTGGGESSILGRVRFRNDRRTVRIDADMRRTHIFMIGRSGVGKSTLLRNLILDDLAKGRGLALVDPHGDLAEDVLEAVPPRRTNDVIYFDAGDASHAIAFNPLAVPRGGDPVLVADGVLAAFQKVFGLEEGNAPRLLHILRNSLLTLVGQPEATLLSVQRLLVDSPFRKSMMTRVTNPIVRAFWMAEFERWRPNDRTEYIASLQNKLGAFLTNTKLQRILGQPHGRIDLRSIMDAGQVLIVNLSKGRVGESASNLLGALLVSSLQLAAMSRADVPQAARPDFSVIIDEFQNFSTPSIATAFAEARKMRCNYVVSHQYLSQLSDDIRDAVIGNAGTMVVFGVAADDAEFFAQQLGDKVTAQAIRGLPRYHAYVRLPGAESRPFLMTTLPPSSVTKPRGELVRRLSRERYGRPVRDVDALITSLVA